jgi:hypothetical protein
MRARWREPAKLVKASRVPRTPTSPKVESDCRRGSSSPETGSPEPKGITEAVGTAHQSSWRTSSTRTGSHRCRAAALVTSMPYSGGAINRTLDLRNGIRKLKRTIFSMRKMLSYLPSATDRDFYFHRNVGCASEWKLYVHLRNKNRVRNPKEYRYVHAWRIRDMCYLMRWFRRSLNRQGLPFKKLPGNAHLMLHPGTAIRWIHDLACSKSFRRSWVKKNSPKWRKMIQNR